MLYSRFFRRKKYVWLYNRHQSLIYIHNNTLCNACITFTAQLQLLKEYIKTVKMDLKSADLTENYFMQLLIQAFINIIIQNNFSEMKSY